MGHVEKKSHLIDILRKADIFGANLNFKIYNYKSHKTLFGALMSTLVCCILLYKVITSLKNIILKEKFSFSIENLPIVQDEISLKNFQMNICSLHAISIQKKLNYFSAEIYLGSFANSTKINYVNFSNNNCAKKVDINSNNTLNLKEYCICLDINNLNLTDEQIPSLKSSDFMFNDTLMMINVKINTTLFPEIGIVNYNQFLISFNRNYVNTSDYNSLINSNIGSFIQLNTPYRTNLIEMYYHNVQIDKKNDLLTFGLFEPDVDSDFSYQYAYKEHSLDQGLETMTFMRIHLKHSKNKILYTINSFSIDEFLSSFGGYFQIMFSFFSLVSGFYNEYSLEKSIAEKLGIGNKSNKHINNVNFNYFSNSDFSKEKKINYGSQIKGIEKELKTTTSNSRKIKTDPMIYTNKNFDINKHINIESKEINEKIFDNDCISLERHEINLPKILPQPSTRSSRYLIYDQISHNSSARKNYNQNQEANKILNTVNGNISQELGNLNINENCKKSYHIDNHEKNESKTSDENLIFNYKKFSMISVDEFCDIFDFNVLYSLFKEIKLLKFFLLNSKNINLYDKFLKLNFSIDKFEQFLCKQKLVNCYPCFNQNKL